MPAFRFPSRIQVAPIIRPIPWTRLDDDGQELESIVEPPGIYQGLVFKSWPEHEIDVTGFKWSAWSWFGWTIVFMWEGEHCS